MGDEEEAGGGGKLGRCRSERESTFRASSVYLLRPRVLLFVLSHHFLP